MGFNSGFKGLIKYSELNRCRRSSSHNFLYRPHICCNVCSQTPSELYGRHCAVAVV